MQQDSGPAVAEHDRHGASRRGLCLELHDRLAYRLLCKLKREVAVKKIAEICPGTAPGVALLTAPTLFENHAHIEANQGADVGRHRAVRGCDQDQVLTARHADDDLFDTRIEGTRRRVQFEQQLCLLAIVDTGCRIRLRIERRCVTPLPGLHTPVLPLAGDRTCSAGRGLKRRHHELVGIGESGLLATIGAHTDALVQTEAAFTNDAVLQRPALLAGYLEVQVRVVDTAAHQAAKRG